MYLGKERLRYLGSIGWNPILDLGEIYDVLFDSLSPWSEQPDAWWHLHQSGSEEWNRGLKEWLSGLTGFIDKLKKVNIPLKIQFGPFRGHNDNLFPHPDTDSPDALRPEPDVSKWLIKELGSRFDELTMHWGTQLSLSDTYPHYTNCPHGLYFDEAPCHSRDTGIQDAAEFSRKLRCEASGVHELFKNLSSWLPNIRRLALYIPAAIYAATDSEFIDAVLPSGDFVWEVRHHGSGGGKGDILGRPKIFDGRPEARYVEKHWPGLEAYRARCERLDMERCPMIHRVFVRTDAASESNTSKWLKGLRTEWGAELKLHTIAELVAAAKKKALLAETG